MRTQRLPVAEPLDWMDSRTPSVWRMGRSDTGPGEEAGANLRFDWLAHS